MLSLSVMILCRLTICPYYRHSGHVGFAGYYLALNHEHDGTLSAVSSTGLYAGTSDGVDYPDAGSGAKLTDGNTIEFTHNTEGSFSSVQSFVFFDDDNAVLSAVHTSVATKSILSINSATVVRITEEDFLSGIEEFNEKYNVPEAMRIQAPMTSDEVPNLNGTFPTEEEWCGGLIDDVSCTVSPYQEPAAQMKGGFIALFVILGILVFGTIAYLLHRKKSEEQKHRYKQHFVRGIARNISIAASAGMVSPDKLQKEFDHINSNGDGTISKDELKKFVESGKVGTIEDKDFEALWHAIDINNSGEVDFVEFLSFLGGCGDEFDAIFQEQQAMTKEEKMKYASQRLSVIQMSKADIAKLEAEYDKDEENADEEKA